MAGFQAKICVGKSSVKKLVGAVLTDRLSLFAGKLF